MRSEVLVPTAVLIANASGVAVSLLAPAFLPPEQYSAFALAWAVGQFLAMAFFEWLRFPALRFSVGRNAALAAGRRAAIIAAYSRVAPMVIVLAVVSALVVRNAGAGLVSALPFALAYAAAQGTFDGNQAFARAARDNMAFALNWAVRAVLSIVLLVAVAWTTRSGGAAVLALSLSFPLTLVIGTLIDARARPEGTPTVARVPAAWAELPRMARYGVLAAASGVVANAVPTVVRWALVDQMGKSGAAGALLAADFAQKALVVTGLAVNVVAMQNSFTAVDTGDAATIDRSNRRQIAWACAAVVPVGLLVWLLSDELARLLMRPEYRPSFVRAIGLCALASGLIYVRLFAIDPLFYAFQRAGFAVLGAAASLGMCVVALGLPRLQVVAVDPLTIFWTSAAGGLIVSTVIAVIVLKVRMPWSQLARVATAAAAMLAADRIAPSWGNLAGLVLHGAVLSATFAGAAWLLDLVQLRTQLLPGLRARGRAKA